MKKGEMTISKLFGVLLLIVIGVALIPVASKGTNDTDYLQLSSTSGAFKLSGLLPLIFVAILIMGAFAYMKG